MDRLYARSEGNPLFTEELLAAGLDGLGAVPPSLAAALALRIERLGDDAQEVVRVLSAGGQLDDAVLAQVAGLDRRALRDGLREAVASHIVVLDGERYALRHALLREAVHDDLLPGERVELHRALARALEAEPEAADRAQRAAAIAHHYLAAGDQPAALAAAVRAGVAAMEVQAYREGGALFERALELWDRVPGAAELAGTDQVELLERAAACQFYSDELARSVTLAKRALALVDEASAPRRAAWLYGHAPALALVDAATRRGRRRARARTRAARRRRPQPRARRAARPPCEDADAPVALSPRGERRPARAERAGRARGPGRLPRRRGRRPERARRLAGGDRRCRRRAPPRCAARSTMAYERGHLQDVAVGAANLSEALHRVGRTGEALEVARAAHAELGPLPTRQLWLSLAIAQYAFDSGDWEAAEGALAGVARRRFSGGNSELNACLRHAELALGRDERDAAGAQLARAAELAVDSREPQYLGVLGALQAELATREGDVAARARRGRRGARPDRVLLGRRAEDGDGVGRRADGGGDGGAARARHRRRRGGRGRARARGAADRARARVRRGRRAAGAGVPGARRGRPLPRGRRRPGRPLGRRGHGLGGARASLPRGDRALAQAEALVAAGEREAATVVASAATAAAERLGATWLAGELESLAARARLRLGDADGEAPVAGDESEDPFGLTPRERQVLALVAAGATNREIGRQLYMAEKTASVHVSRILSKLDVRSRTEAAGVAHRLGLDAVV